MLNFIYVLFQVGTGFTDEMLVKLTDIMNEHIIEVPPFSYNVVDEPDVWFDSKVLVEVRAADLSLSPVYKAAVGKIDPNKGIALRFPRFLRIREDKRCDQATNAEQIKDMYYSQDVIPEVGKMDGMDLDDF